MAWNFVIQFIITIAVSFISNALAPKPPGKRPIALTDFTVPTAEEGRPLPVVLGTVTITGANVIWYGDLKYEAITQKSGGK
jgi:hypothetical protein